MHVWFQKKPHGFPILSNLVLISEPVDEIMRKFYLLWLMGLKA